MVKKKEEPTIDSLRLSENNLWIALEMSPSLRTMKNSDFEGVRNYFRNIQYALEEFVKRCPEDVLIKLFEKDNIRFHAHYDVPLASISFPREHITIEFFPGAYRMRPKKLVGVIAHEMAHAYLGAPQFIEGDDIDSFHEDDADKLAIQWGFDECLPNLQKFKMRKKRTKGGEIVR